MGQDAFQRMLEYSTAPAALEDSVAYLTEQFRRIIRKGESVLVCFPRVDKKHLGSMMEQAILAAEGVPVFLEGDLRWSELLRLAFFTRASTVIGTPLMVLGLSKLAAFRGVPLFVFNAVLTGYPCMDWIMDGIISGLDCRVWELLAPKLSTMVAGASCERGRGIHLRQDQYDVRIKDEAGHEVPDGTGGRVYLICKDDPALELYINASAVLLDGVCSCGNPAPKLISMDYGNHSSAAKYRILEELLYWNSVLDCWVKFTDGGMELEVLYLPGLKLPKFPSCAKLELRPWNPEEDVPFEIRDYFEKNKNI